MNLTALHVPRRGRHLPHGVVRKDAPHFLPPHVPLPPRRDARAVVHHHDVGHRRARRQAGHTGSVPRGAAIRGTGISRGSGPLGGVRSPWVCARLDATASPKHTIAAMWKRCLRIGIGRNSLVNLDVLRQCSRRTQAVAEVESDVEQGFGIGISDSSPAHVRKNSITISSSSPPSVITCARSRPHSTNPSLL